MYIMNQFSPMNTLATNFHCFSKLPQVKKTTPLILGKCVTELECTSAVSTLKLHFVKYHKLIGFC